MLFDNNDRTRPEASYLNILGKDWTQAKHEFNFTSSRLARAQFKPGMFQKCASSIAMLISRCALCLWRTYKTYLVV